MIYTQLSRPPDKPTTPTEPENPTTPTTPTEPENPTTPTTPTEPENPTTPTTPAEPENPTMPTTPAEPENPTTPTTPTEPENPTTPAPTEPEQPSQSTQVTGVTQPTAPAQPSDHQQPEIISPYVSEGLASADASQLTVLTDNGHVQSLTVVTPHQPVGRDQAQQASEENSFTISSSAVKQANQPAVAAENGATGYQEGHGQGLPQTGNSQSILATILGLITEGLSLLGLRKRHF